jgi:hypothetical protein
MQGIEFLRGLICHLRQTADKSTIRAVILSSETEIERLFDGLKYLSRKRSLEGTRTIGAPRKRQAGLPQMTVSFYNLCVFDALYCILRQTTQTDTGRQAI